MRRIPRWGITTSAGSYTPAVAFDLVVMVIARSKTHGSQHWQPGELSMICARKEADLICAMNSVTYFYMYKL